MDLTDTQWDFIKDLLPEEELIPRQGRGRPWKDPRGNCQRFCGSFARARRGTTSLVGIRRKKGGSYVGRTRAGKTTKIMAIADRRGLPIAVGIASGHRHEVGLAEDALEACVFEDLPQTLIGDRAYDSRKLREALLRERNVEPICPARRNRSGWRRKQDGRKMRRYKRRWLVERLFSWFQGLRRVATRWEYKAANDLGFVHLACIRLLLRRL